MGSFVAWACRVSQCDVYRMWERSPPVYGVWSDRIAAVVGESPMATMPECASGGVVKLDCSSGSLSWPRADSRTKLSQGCIPLHPHSAGSGPPARSGEAALNVDLGQGAFAQRLNWPARCPAELRKLALRGIRWRANP